MDRFDFDGWITSCQGASTFTALEGNAKKKCKLNINLHG